jgi:hypothetical protein
MLNELNPGLSLRFNPGLKLANAFGVTSKLKLPSTRLSARMPRACPVEVQDATGLSRGVSRLLLHKRKFFEYYPTLWLI